MTTITRPPLERLQWVEQANGCWEATLVPSLDGYVYIAREWPDRSKVLVHRLVFEHHNGPIPVGLVVDHHCHNLDPTCPGGRVCRHRRCVRLDHLRAVTKGENTRAGKRWH